MTGLLEGKVALVTGGASGIGAATAALFIREGARVVIADLENSQGPETVERLRGEGGEVRFCATDVTQEDEVKALVEFCVDSYGTLDCASNNAGIAGKAAPLHETPIEDWRLAMSVNATGTFLCMKYELPIMQQQGTGAIVNISSGAGIIATPGLSPYCASKHAILGLTKTAAVENARTGVRVNAVCPGSTDTPMLQAAMAVSPMVKKLVMSSVPTGRLGRPEEIAEAIVWLCSDHASYVSGHTMLVDGASVVR